MEEDLDKIAEGKLYWENLLDRFYKDFEPKVENAFTSMEKSKPEETGELCPNCNSPLVIKRSKYGKFVACSNYPECKYIKNDKVNPIEIIPCPKCGGKIVEKKRKRVRYFMDVIIILNVNLLLGINLLVNCAQNAVEFY